jgi:hypothetical protein
LGWADDATGKRRNLSLQEEQAFWVWAMAEVLRATGRSDRRTP